MFHFFLSFHIKYDDKFVFCFINKRNKYKSYKKYSFAGSFFSNQIFGQSLLLAFRQAYCTIANFRPFFFKNTDPLVIQPLQSDPLSNFVKREKIINKMLLYVHKISLHHLHIVLHVGMGFITLII